MSFAVEVAQVGVDVVGLHQSCVVEVFGIGYACDYDALNSAFWA